MNSNKRGMKASRGQAILLMVSVATWVFVTSCAKQPANAVRQPDSASTKAVVDEARAFMDAYARELLAGDRAAIGARYDRTGAYFLGNGRKEFVTYDSVVAQYKAASWSPPASFSWRDLTFEPAGPDAVVVAGQFVWGANTGGATLSMSYTALLRRQDGVLRIRVEDESLDPTSVPTAPAASDSGKR